MNAERPHIVEAQPMGLCAGVVRAVQAYDQFIQQARQVDPGAIIYSVGEPAHNTHIIDRFKDQGVQFVKHVSEVPDGAKALFGPHGSTPEDIEEARRRGLTFVDTECPLVTKVKEEVGRNAKKGRTTLYYGQEGHAEARAVMGVASDSAILIEGIEQALGVEVSDPENVAFNTQTTHNYDEAMEMARVLKERFPHLVLPPKVDACFATRNRQAAVGVVAEKVDAMVVVGSRHSSNSKRLSEVARQRGVINVFFVDSADELDPEVLAKFGSIGLSAGASVEEDQIEKVRELLGGNVERVVVADESKIVFAPPVINRPNK